MEAPKPARHRIVIVGGGAGGLPLAARLGDKLGRRGRAEITLVDRFESAAEDPIAALTEVSPLLREVFELHELQNLALAIRQRVAGKLRLVQRRLDDDV